MIGRRQTRARRRGNALVEFLIVLPFFCTLLFGAMEFGTLFYERIELTNACRDGLRHFSLGESPDSIRTAVQNAAPRLGITAGQIDLQWKDAGGAWRPVVYPGYQMRSGVSLVRVDVRWTHGMHTGTLFSWLPGVTAGRFPMKAGEVTLYQGQ
jgi:Flp pilus assembly protein TadG